MGKEKKSIQLVMLSRFNKSGGGRETWFYNFMPRLYQLDPEFTLDVLGYKMGNSNLEVENAFASLRDRITFNFFELKPSKVPLFFKMWKRVFLVRKKEMIKPYDYVIAMGMFELIMILTSNYKGAKKVVWLRGIFLHEKASKYPSFLMPFFRKIEIFLLKKANIVFANGSDIKEFYSSPNLNINVILNGVDLQRWKPKQESFQVSSPIKIAYVGRLSQVKGFLEFLEAANRTLLLNSKDFEFHIVGDGELKHSEAFKSKDKRIIYHGAIDNELLPQFLINFHVCVALTLADETGGGGGTSNALLEQMALGLVIVAWDNRIFRQVLTLNEAYLVEQKKVDQLVAAYLEILTDPVKAKEKAAKVLEKASTFAIDAKVKAYNEFFS